jgi:signal transduction histidine kinase
MDQVNNLSATRAVGGTKSLGQPVSWARPWSLKRCIDGALVSVSMVVLLSAGYLALLAGATVLLGRPTTDAATVGAAIAVTSLLFPAARILVDRVLDRVREGGRPAPYSVLAKVAALSGGAAATHRDLAAVAEAVGRGLGVSVCRLTLCIPEHGDRSYEWTGDIGYSGEQLTLPVPYAGERVGELAVDRASFARLNPARRRLLGDLLDILGPALHNRQLGTELQFQLSAALKRARQIASSRRRAIAEMDSERRALERNLHDGVQHHLVALQMTIGLLDHDLAQGRSNTALDRVGDLIEQVDVTRAVLADTAAGVFPITLADEGLVPALAAELRDAAPAVVLELDDSASNRRFPLDVETAIYFTCLEAVNNARKHAPGATVTVTIRNDYRGLAFTVADSGPGFQDEAGAPGRGLRNIADRIESVGGSITVLSERGTGTVIDAFIPF